MVICLPSRVGFLSTVPNSDTASSNRAIKFLQDGNKVRVCLRFRGREIAHQELGKEMLAKFEEAVSEFGTVDKKPTLDGKQMTMFVSPVKPAK